MPDPITPPVDPAAPPVVPPAAVPPAPVVPPVVVPPAVVPPVAVPPAAVPPAAKPATEVAPPAGESPAEKQLREALDRLGKLETQNRDNLIKRIAAESGLKAEASEFLTATDEAGLRAQAEKLKAFAPAPVAPPVGRLGSITNPGAPAGGPTIEERIAASEKTGSKYESLSLKLELMNGAE
jgi:hypothetical protein